MVVILELILSIVLLNINSKGDLGIHVYNGDCNGSSLLTQCTLQHGIPSTQIYCFRQPFVMLHLANGDIKKMK